MDRCSSCGMNILSKDNFVKFKCPACGNTLIVRCHTCKSNSNKYSCSECGFIGP